MARRVGSLIWKRSQNCWVVSHSFLARRAFKFGHHLPDGGFDLFEVVLRHANGFWSVNQVRGFFSFASDSSSVHLGRM